MSRTMMIAAALSLPVLAAAPAYAGSDQTNLDLCRAELISQTAGDENAAEIEFKSMRGASLQTLTFEITTDGEASTATCKVKRGQIVGLDWDGAQYAQKS